MIFEDRFGMSRKGRTGRGGWVHPKGTNSMAVSGFSFGNTLVGAGWAISVLCTNGLRNLAQKIQYQSTKRLRSVSKE